MLRSQFRCKDLAFRGLRAKTGPCETPFHRCISRWRYFSRKVEIFHGVSRELSANSTRSSTNAAVEGSTLPITVSIIRRFTRINPPVCAFWFMPHSRPRASRVRENSKARSACHRTAPPAVYCPNLGPYDEQAFQTGWSRPLFGS